MVEGITTIELTDVNTGEVEKIESKNMVTNAVRDLIKNPILFDKIRLKDHMPFYNSFFGGLSCFNTSLQEDANNYFAPLTADTIATGAINFKNTYDDGIRGSYNNIESEVNKEQKYVKFVYDFTTQQGNGIIRSVCLTHPSAGYGISATGVFDKDRIINKYNNTDAYFYSETNNDWNSGRDNVKYFDFCQSTGAKLLFSLDLSNSEAIGYYWSSWRENDRDGNYVDMHCKLTQYKRKIYLNEAPSIFTELGEEYVTGSYDIKLSEILSLIPESVKNNFPDKVKRTINEHNTYGTKYFFGIDENEKIYVFVFLQSWGDSKGTLNCFSLNLDNQKLTYINSKNDFPEFYLGTYDSTQSAYGYYNYVMFKIANNFLYFNYNNRVYKISLPDLTLIDLCEGSVRGIDCKNHFCLISTDDNKTQFKTSLNGRYKDHVLFYYDYINDKFKYSYLTNPYSQNDREIYIFDKQNPLFLLFPADCYDEYTYWRLSYRKNYLATINNLPEPIEKTQDKTMKITYTLREV